jgi:phytoene synthase
VRSADRVRYRLAAMTPAQYCRDKVRAPGSSFYYSALFLPSEQRAALTALQAFLREISEVGEECSDAAVARTKLAWWQEELESTFAAKPRHPVTKALLPVIGHYNLSREVLLRFIDDVSGSLQHARCRTFIELREYCDRIGATGSLLSATILGCRQPDTLASARELGVAFELARVVRDIGIDARRDRIYIPAEDLARLDIPETDVLAGVEHRNFQALMTQQVQRVEDCYRRAIVQLPQDERVQLLPSLITAAIARATLAKIREAGYPVLRERVTLTPLRKLWIAWRMARAEKHHLHGKH